MKSVVTGDTVLTFVYLYHNGMLSHLKSTYKWLFPPGFPTKTSPRRQKCHMPRPPLFFLFDHLDNIC
jgi:hypothetical protein